MHTPILMTLAKLIFVRAEYSDESMPVITLLTEIASRSARIPATIDTLMLLTKPELTHALLLVLPTKAESSTHIPSAIIETTSMLHIDMQINSSELITTVTAITNIAAYPSSSTLTTLKLLPCLLALMYSLSPSNMN